MRMLLDAIDFQTVFSLVMLAVYIGVLGAIIL